MCNCIQELQKRIVSEGDYKGKKITKATFPIAILFGSKVSSKPYAEIELEVEGFKRPQKQSVLFSFCPFCGVEIDPQEKSEAC